MSLNKTQTAIYLIVRIDIEHNINLNIEDIENKVISNMDYNFEYYTDEAHISMTEICGTQNYKTKQHIIDIMEADEKDGLYNLK